MHQRIYERPAEWNALRYKREYNHNLYTDLLFEEYSEYETAKTLVDKLDGLADIFFISIGALWKLGKSPYSYITYVHKQTLKYPSVAHARAERYTSAMPQIVHRILNLGESPQELEHLKKCICHLLDLLNYEFAYCNLNPHQRTACHTELRSSIKTILPWAHLIRANTRTETNKVPNNKVTTINFFSYG